MVTVLMTSIIKRNLGPRIMGTHTIAIYQRDLIIIPLHRDLVQDSQVTFILKARALDNTIMGVFPNRDKVTREWEAKEGEESTSEGKESNRYGYL